MRLFFSHRVLGGFRVGLVVPLAAAARRAAPGPIAADPVRLSYCYVARGDHGLVKIGSSTNPAARIKQLQTASPFRLELCHILATDASAEAIELEAHRVLDKHRMAGEWFDVTPDRAFEALDTASRNLGFNPVTTTLGDLRDGNVPAPQRRFWPRTFTGQIAAVIWIGVFVVIAAGLLAS